MADQQSKTDQNGRSTLLAVNSSGELRRVVVNDDGTPISGLPAGVTLGDNLANPTTSLVGACLLGVSGGTWWRIGAQTATVGIPEQGIALLTSGPTMGRIGSGSQDFMIPRLANIFKPLDAVSIASEATLWTPTSGKKFRLLGYHLSASVAGNVLLKDGNAGSTIAVVPAGAGGSGVFVNLGSCGILSGAADRNLRAIGPATSTLSGIVFGIEE